MKINLEDLNLEQEKYIIVGVSAGPDSMALLHYLINNLNTNIVCAHINHNVRKESEIEEEYLKEYCKENKIIFERMKIEKYSNNNFEAEARSKRYEFYASLLKKYNCKYLFLAHHGDDLIETVLMKIARGSNLEGYAGIKKISKFRNKYFIVRPFLEYTKKDLIEYLHKNNIKYYIDKSNNDTTYTRNRYRKNILPLLKNEDINIHKKFLKYSETLLEYDNYIKNTTKSIVNNFFKNNILDIQEFNKIDDFMKKNSIYYILNNLYNNIPNIVTEKHVQNLQNLINSNVNNGCLNMPKGLVIVKEYNKIIFNFKNLSSDDYKIELKSENIINEHIIKYIDNCENDGNDVCRLNSKEIALPLYLRNKKSGDFLEILGLNGKKKVKDIFIEKKIPIRKRESYPLLVDNNDNILWIPNLKKSKFNKKKEEKYDIILKYYEREEEINE